ncbi:MAG: aminoglycoside phosphotransferase family protein [Cyclobacteriaceae bacterium]
MSDNKNKDVTGVLRQFQIEGTVERHYPFGSGHINDTYRVETKEVNSLNYLLQRVNHNIFKNVPKLIENIDRVTSHLRRKLHQVPGADPDREVLTLIPTYQGAKFVQDEEGNYYRLYIFIEDHNAYDIVETVHQAQEAGKMFGRFQNFLSDIPGGPLYETIPDFHNIESRLDKLFEAVKVDKVGRVKKVKELLKFVEERADEMKILLNLYRDGDIPERVTHNDTKFNNVLLDKQDNGLCVIDLDTIMPGIAHYDFGDSIRTGTNTAAEDEPDLYKVNMNIDLYEGYTRGYLEEMRSLTDLEIQFLPLGAKLLPYMIGTRFLTDYLDGDNYFKIHREGHNLQRAKAQYKLLSSMEEQYARMQDIVSQVNADLTENPEINS